MSTAALTASRSSTAPRESSPASIRGSLIATSLPRMSLTHPATLASTAEAASRLIEALTGVDLADGVPPDTTSVGARWANSPKSGGTGTVLRRKRSQRKGLAAITERPADRVRASSTARPCWGEMTPTPRRSMRWMIPASPAAMPPPPLHAPHCTLVVGRPWATVVRAYASSHPFAAP